jgi:hypothetical protein
MSDETRLRTLIAELELTRNDLAETRAVLEAVREAHAETAKAHALGQRDLHCCRQDALRLVRERDEARSALAKVEERGVACSACGWNDTRKTWGAAAPRPEPAKGEERPCLRCNGTGRNPADSYACGHRSIGSDRRVDRCVDRPGHPARLDPAPAKAAPEFDYRYVRARLKDLGVSFGGSATLEELRAERDEPSPVLAAVADEIDRIRALFDAWRNGDEPEGAPSARRTLLAIGEILDAKETR